MLGDYSAAGMLSTFAWIDAAEVGQRSVPATLVRDGASESVSLQRLLTGQRYGRVRLAVLVPVHARPGNRVPLAAEQTVERLMRSAAVGAEVTLLRLLLTGQADAAPGRPGSDAGTGGVAQPADRAGGLPRPRAGVTDHRRR